MFKTSANVRTPLMLQQAWAPNVPRSWRDPLPSANRRWPLSLPHVASTLAVVGIAVLVTTSTPRASRSTRALCCWTTAAAPGRARPGARRRPGQCRRRCTRGRARSTAPPQVPHPPACCSLAGSRPDCQKIVSRRATPTCPWARRSCRNWRRRPARAALQCWVPCCSASTARATAFSMGPAPAACWPRRSARRSTTSLLPS
mmetsp:Transcript_155123/g.497387  ORF Transcript_155123/g.497387 Transcript_155123/m.497387 type:complete len:201 (+) Transcript_155123:71-673(+)